MTKISNQYSLTNILTADLANSRLGINNVNPTVALDVTGAGKFSSSVTATTFSSVNSTPQMDFVLSANTAFKHSIVASTFSSSPISANILDFRVANGANSQVTVMNLTGAGNVGIGTTSPTAKLEVIGYGTANSIMTYVCAKFYGAGTGGINIGTDGTNPQIATDSSGVDLTFLTRVAGTFSERMRITSGGSLLVGTTSDNGNKLQVSGGISASGNISGANIGGSSFSMNFGSTFNYGTGYLKSSTNGITVTTSTTTIFTSTNIGGVNSGNLVLVSGVRAGNGPTFTDLILYMNSGSISVISSQIFSTPPSRNYSVSNENLNLSMASGTYIVACVALNQGYTNP